MVVPEHIITIFGAFAVLRGLGEILFKQFLGGAELHVLNGSVVAWRHILRFPLDGGVFVVPGGYLFLYRVGVAPERIHSLT